MNEFRDRAPITPTAALPRAEHAARPGPAGVAALAVCVLGLAACAGDTVAVAVMPGPAADTTKTAALEHLQSRPGTCRFTEAGVAAASGDGKAPAPYGGFYMESDLTIGAGGDRFRVWVREIGGQRSCMADEIAAKPQTDSRPVRAALRKTLTALSALGAAYPGAGGLGPGALDPDKPRLGIRIDGAPGGVRVLEVFPKTAAQAAGLAAGDIITAAGGGKLGTMEDLIKAVQGSAWGATLELTVERGGKTLAVSVHFVKPPA